MSKYLVEVSHTTRECVWALKTLLDEGPDFLARFDWGCKTGEHVGWAIVDVENIFVAQELVPRAMRPKARFVELNQFSPAEVQALHQAQT